MTGSPQTSEGMWGMSEGETMADGGSGLTLSAEGVHGTVFGAGGHAVDVHIVTVAAEAMGKVRGRRGPGRRHCGTRVGGEKHPFPTTLVNTRSLD